MCDIGDNTYPEKGDMAMSHISFFCITVRMKRFYQTRTGQL